MQHWLSDISKILESDSKDLRSLAELTSKEPKNYFIGCDLSGLNIGGQNLSGLTFENAIVNMTKYDRKTISDCPFLINEIITGNKFPEEKYKTQFKRFVPIILKYWSTNIFDINVFINIMQNISINEFEYCLRTNDISQKINIKTSQTSGNITAGVGWKLDKFDGLKDRLDGTRVGIVREIATEKEWGKNINKIRDMYNILASRNGYPSNRELITVCVRMKMMVLLDGCVIGEAIG